MITEQDIRTAVACLSRSERGRAAMSDVLTMLDRGGLSLDQSGQAAVLKLLVASWSSNPGTARDAMRDALE